MAEILDARVKQKTGTAAEFAGYTLLEGEIALVRTSANGPVWNFKVGPGNFDSLDWSLQNPGAAQKADTSTVFPAGVPGLYIPIESGTIGGVPVDLSAGYTQLIWDGANLVDVVFPIDLAGYVAKSQLITLGTATITKGSSIVIDTTAKTITTTLTGDSYVSDQRGVYRSLGAGTTNFFNSPTVTTGIHHVVFNRSNNLLEVYHLHRAGDIPANAIWLGSFIIGVSSVSDWSGSSPVTINGKQYGLPELKYVPYKKAMVMGNIGMLVIDTVNRTVAATGTVLLAWNGQYVQISGFSPTAWEGSGGGLYYVLLDERDNSVHVVRYSSMSSYDPINTALLGTIVRRSGTLNYIVNIDGDYIVDGVEYPLKPVDISPTFAGIIGSSDLGHTQYQGLLTDYSHVWAYGQSLCIGHSNNLDSYTTTPVDGALMIGDRVWIQEGNPGTLALNPLIATPSDTSGESPMVAMAQDFKQMFERFNNKAGQNELIASVGGDSGTSIEWLSKDCTNVSGGVVENNLYHTTFLEGLSRAKSIADTASKTISCPFIVFMQGEYNYPDYTANRGMTPGSNATSDKAAYKALLLQLKNDMQADVMSVYGQTEPPLFFVYQTSGTYMSGKTISISQAQLEFVMENEDCIMLSPHYAMPGYSGGHKTPNGYRWMGELYSKALNKVFNKGERYMPVVPKNYIVDTENDEITIEFYVPVPPLVFDTNLAGSISQHGFTLWVNSSVATISSVSVGPNHVTIKSATPLTGTIELSYAGSERNGVGTLRDSDTYRSRYLYVDDSASSAPPSRQPLGEDGQPLYGKKYPLYNWCVSFYKSITI